MTHLGTLLAAWWAQLWPNLVADVIAVGTGLIWHHRRTRRLVGGLHERVEHLHARLDAIFDPDADEPGE